MQINNLKIGARLGAAFGALLILMAVMLATALWEFTQISEARGTMELADRKVKLAHEWLAGIATNGVRTLAKAKSSDPDDIKYFDGEMKATSANVTKVQKEIEDLIESDKGKALLQAVAEKRKQYTSMREQAFARKASVAADDAELKSFVNTTLMGAMNTYVQSVADVVAYQEGMFAAASAEIEKRTEHAQSILIVLGATSLILAAALGLALTRSITGPLSIAVGLAQRVASGDLTADIKVTSTDEIGQLLVALNGMNTNLLATVSKVRSSTDAIVSAAEQIATGNFDLSERTEHQARALEETAASTEEMTSTVSQNAGSAREANQLAQSASTIASKGGQVVAGVVSTMESINDSSKKIADIIGVIDGIAFQTNILALNAAVEAARAGEQGRGFAVVASEVRNLAQRSASAAKEIRTLISSSVEKVAAGTAQVDEAGATMREIVEGVTRVTDIMSEIAIASAEQTRGIEQINAVIIQMDGTTQQNATLVEEASAAANSLREQANMLAELVSTFNVGDADHLGAYAVPSVTPERTPPTSKPVLHLH